MACSHYHTHTPYASLVVSGNHRESVVLFLMEYPNASLVLGHPWLVQHSPHVDWSRSQIMYWSQSCHACCLGVASPLCLCLLCCRLRQLILPGSRRSTLICGWFSASYEPPRFPPVAVRLPRGHIFSMSGPEREAMDYIQESIKAGLIRHSSSPAGAGFFFFKKKKLKVSRRCSTHTSSLKVVRLTYLSSADAVLSPVAVSAIEMSW